MAGTAARHATTTVLRGGAIVAGIGFLVGLALAVAKGGVVAGSVALTSVPAGLLALDPSAWLTGASIVLIGTPSVALVTTALEFAPVDRRSAAVCGLLLLIFATSLVLTIRS
jgi:uncharacterized membrane protein